MVPDLKTVDQHNEERRKAREEQAADLLVSRLFYILPLGMERKARMTGVACPKCGKELFWVQDYSMSLFSFPAVATRSAGCPGCSLSIKLEI